MGHAAPLEVCLPLPTPSCVGILHLPCACFLDLEKTPSEPDMVACACNPSTRKWRQEDQVFKVNPRYGRACLKKGRGGGIHSGYWYEEDSPQSTK